MALIAAPLIKVASFFVRLAVFIWLINFLRYFARIPDDVDSGLWTFSPSDVSLLSSAFIAASVIAYRMGKSILLSLWRNVTGFVSLITHDIRHQAKIRAAKQRSILTFEDELADAAEDQLKARAGPR